MPVHAVVPRRRRRAVPDGPAVLRLLLGLLVAIAVVTACAADPGSETVANGDGSAESSQASGATETFAEPEPEPTTPDVPAGSGSKGDPAIQVARLPVGGDSQDDGEDARLQCAHVTWIADDEGQIPQGTGVELTRILFDPASFEAVAEGCGVERPSCLHYVFRASATQCDLAVRATGEVPQDANPKLGFTGLVFCPDNDSDTCRRFVAALGQQEQVSVTLNVPQPSPAATETTEPPAATETTEPPAPTETTGSPATEGG